MENKNKEITKTKKKGSKTAAISPSRRGVWRQQENAMRKDSRFITICVFNKKEGGNKET